MSINAEPSQQPQVRTASLPTNAPRALQRPAAPQDSAQPAQAAEGAQPAEGVSGKPKRKYTPRKKPQLNDGAGLSRDELAAWGEIAIEARQAGVSVERYMAGIEEKYGLKLQVWSKLKTPAQAEQAVDSAEAPVAEA